MKDTKIGRYAYPVPALVASALVGVAAAGWVVVVWLLP